MAATMGAAMQVFGTAFQIGADKNAEKRIKRNRRRQADMLRKLAGREQSLAAADLNRTIDVAEFRRGRQIGQSRAGFSATGARMSSGSSQTALRELEMETRKEVEQLRERGEAEIDMRRREREAQIQSVRLGVPQGGSQRRAGMMLSGFASALQTYGQSQGG